LHTDAPASAGLLEPASTQRGRAMDPAETTPLNQPGTASEQASYAEEAGHADLPADLGVQVGTRCTSTRRCPGPGGPRCREPPGALLGCLSLPCLQGRADSIRLAQKRLSVARGESWDERRAQPHSRLFSEGPRLQRLTSGTSPRIYEKLGVGPWAITHCAADAAAGGLARSMRTISERVLRRASLTSSDHVPKEAHTATAVALVASAALPAQRTEVQGKVS